MSIRWIVKKRGGRHKREDENIIVPKFKNKGSYAHKDVGIGIQRMNGRYHLCIRMNPECVECFPHPLATNFIRIGIDGNTMYFASTQSYDDGYTLNRRAYNRYFVRFRITPREAVERYAEWVGYYNFDFDETKQMYCIRRENAEI